MTLVTTEEGNDPPAGNLLGTETVVRRPSVEFLTNDQLSAEVGLRLVDHTHAALAELFGDLVVGHRLADHRQGDCTATGYLVVTRLRTSYAILAPPSL